MLPVGLGCHETPLQTWSNPQFHSLSSIPFKDFADPGELQGDADMESVAERIQETLQESCSAELTSLLVFNVKSCIKSTAHSEHLYISYLLSVLGWRLNTLSLHALAEAAHRRALCIAIKVLGQDHPDLTCSMDWLAFSLLIQGNFKEAVLLCYSSMVIVCKSVGPLHPKVASCYFNLGTVLEAMGLFGHAGVLRSQGYALLQMLPDSHPCPMTPPVWGEFCHEDPNCFPDSPASICRENEMLGPHSMYQPYTIGFVPIAPIAPATWTPSHYWCSYDGGMHSLGLEKGSNGNGSQLVDEHPL